MTTKIIINADDFGSDISTNEAIAVCFDRGFVNSTSMIVNMAAFDQGIELAGEHHFLHKIGIHINLTEGKPLTDLGGTGLLNRDGTLSKEAIHRPFAFSKRVSEKIKVEIEQQHARLVNAGVHPTHMDSHHHIHSLPWLSKLFSDVAIKNKLNLRLANIRRRNLIFRIYNVMLNKYYRRNGLQFSDRFETIESFTRSFPKWKDKALTCEIMTHPGYKAGMLVDLVNEENLEESIQKLRLAHKWDTKIFVDEIKGLGVIFL